MAACPPGRRAYGPQLVIDLTPSIGERRGTPSRHRLARRTRGGGWPDRRLWRLGFQDDGRAVRRTGTAGHVERVLAGEVKRGIRFAPHLGLQVRARLAHG